MDHKDLIQLLTRKSEQRAETQAQGILKDVLRCLHYRATPAGAVCPHNCAAAQLPVCQKTQTFLWGLFKEVREEIAGAEREKGKAAKGSDPAISSVS